MKVFKKFFWKTIDFVEIKGGGGRGGGWKGPLIYVIMMHCVRKSICDLPLSLYNKDCELKIDE